MSRSKPRPRVGSFAGLTAGLVLLIAAACAAPARASIAADSLTALKGTEPSDSFTFIVWGDNRCRAGALGSPAFSRIISEANALAPAFTIGVGDLIPGADDEDPKWTREQWADFAAAVKRFHAPCFPLPGNHDLDGATSNAMYEEVAGPRRYAFDFGASRFIILDSQDALDASSEQFRWLGERLAAQPRARNVFLFLHAPLFFADSWEPVHVLLRRFPVRAVFAGHEHLYCYEQRDGIQYVVTGGAGAPLRDPPEKGGFHHYLIANVRDDDLSLAVVKDGAILPAQCVLHRDFTMIDKTLAAIEAPQVEAPAGECAVVTAAATVRNPGDRAWDGVARWQTSGGWLIEPEVVRFSLAPGEEASLPFTVHPPGPLSARYPLPELGLEYAVEKSRSLAFAKPLRLRNLLRCARAHGSAAAPAPVSITPPIFFRPMPDDLSASVQLGWEAQALRVLIRVTDDIARNVHSGEELWDGDSVELFFDMRDDGNARGHEGDDYEFCAGRGAKGVEVWRYPAADESSAGPSRGSKCEIPATASGRVYDIAIPWAELAPFKAKAGAAFGFSMVVNDDDGLKAGGLTWVELTPGAGSGRKPFPHDRVVLE